MAKLITHDQAAGLRELSTFQGSQDARVITIAGGKTQVGRTSVTVNLASALARAGQRILLIDENSGYNNICTTIGLRARFDLMHVIKRDKKLEQVVVQGPENIFILSAKRGIQALNKLNLSEQDWLIRSFSEFSESIDIVLIDTAMAGTTHVLPLSLASEQVLVVISGSAASLTGAYALIKIMNQQYTRKHFLIVVNKADSEAESLAIYRNLYNVARQYLTVTLEYIGYIQYDEKLRDAMQLCKPILEAFPDSQAAICFRQLAQSVLRSANQCQYSGGIDNFMQRLIRTSHLSMADHTV